MARTTKPRSGKTIICRNEVHGTMEFHLIAGHDSFYLFSTRYFSKALFQEYQNGKPFEEVLVQAPTFRHRKSVHRKRNDDLAAKRFELVKQKLKERIIRTVKYIEHEYILSSIEDVDCDVA